MTINQISVFVENSQGRLVQITETLAKANVDIRAISISDTVDFGILRLIVSDPDAAQAALAAAGFMVSVTDVLAVSVEDTPGSFAKTCAILSNEGINIEYVYAFVTQKAETAYVIFRLSDNARACSVLEANGVHVASRDEIAGL